MNIADMANCWANVKALTLLLLCHNSATRRAPAYRAYFRWNHGSHPRVAVRRNPSTADHRFASTDAVCRHNAGANRANASGKMTKLFDRTGGVDHVTMTSVEARAGVVP